MADGDPRCPNCGGYLAALGPTHMSDCRPASAGFGQAGLAGTVGFQDAAARMAASFRELIEQQFRMAETDQAKRAVMTAALAAAVEAYWKHRPGGFTFEAALDHLPSTVLTYLVQYVAKDAAVT